jgi:hypothetical protein
VVSSTNKNFPLSSTIAATVACGIHCMILCL